MGRRAAITVDHRFAIKKKNKNTFFSIFLLLICVTSLSDAARQPKPVQTCYTKATVWKINRFVRRANNNNRIAETVGQIFRITVYRSAAQLSRVQKGLVERTSRHQIYRVFKSPRTRHGFAGFVLPIIKLTVGRHRADACIRFTFTCAFLLRQRLWSNHKTLTRSRFYIKTHIAVVFDFSLTNSETFETERR